MSGKYYGAIALAGLSTMASAAPDEKTSSFVDDSHLTVTARNFYFLRDYRNAPNRSNNGEEWAQGFIADFASGYTPGVIGFGVDAQATLGVKLDSGPGRSGRGLLAVDEDGEPRDDFSKINGAFKAKVGETVIKYGSQMPTSPVFATGTARLLPSTTEGWSILSNDIKDVTVDIGHFTRGTGGASTNRDGSFFTSYGGTEFNAATFAGFTYKPISDLSLTLYGAKYEDLWKQAYVNANYNLVLSNQQALNFDFNAYDTKDTGNSKAGKIDVLAWSFATSYSVSAHKFTLAYQQIDGDEPYDYLLQDGGNAGNSVWLNNSVQYSDFNGPNEKSVQARYDMNMETYGVPGLTFMVRYVTGFDIDGSKADPNGAYAGLYGADEKHWERDIEVKYVVQSGPAKDLSFRVRQATHRASSFDNDIDEVRIITEYPLNIF
ncbi:OprD family porin [Pseudomonas fluorescens]|uniref:Porin D n=1 Tax=Pseudomonas fluorescens TaxID=294 RepID=A0A5E7SEL5_PSEFL|nr:OprD family porin [Pseudomonas fluorescens]VVP85221.1 Porin D [Pseudomonas fluorescens]